MSMNYQNVAAYNAVTSRATAAANDAYQKAQAANQGEQIALDKAKLAWQKEMDAAGMTGQWQGQWSMPTQQYFANTFGTWGAPTTGQQTLAGQQQQWNQAYQNAMAYGQYYAPGSAPTQGQQTQQAQQQAYQQALQNAQTFGTWFNPGEAPAAGAQTQAAQQQAFAQQMAQQQFGLQQQQFGQQTAQQYLNLLASLRGPADWAKYQQVLGSTPGGMQNLVAAAMGQYVPGGGATTGVQPTPASLQSMYGDVTGQQNLQALQGGQPGGQPGGGYQFAVQPGGGQAFGIGAGGALTPQQQSQRQQAGGGNYQFDVQPGGGQAFNIGPGGTLNPAEQAQRQQAAGGGTNTMGGATQPQYNLPAPNQIAAQSWKNMAPSQQQMMLGMYEAQGWDKNDVNALFNQSLPKYAGNAPGAGTWRLR